MYIKESCPLVPSLGYARAEVAVDTKKQRKQEKQEK